jgi:hypothetical protein
MRVKESIRGGFHFSELSAIVILWLTATNVGDDFKIGVEHGDETATLAVGGPIISEMSNEVVTFMLFDLTRITAGQWNAGELFSLKIKAKEILLIAHGDEQTVLSCLGRF